jgi:hypothetical protein
LAPVVQLAAPSFTELQILLLASVGVWSSAPRIDPTFLGL